MKKVLIIFVVVALAIGGLVLLGKDKDSDKGSTGNANASATQAGIEARTSGNGPVVLEEFADFQCPGCGAFYPIVKQLKEANPEKMKFVFMNFPLQTIHPNARAAHRAGQAAANQGKFWEMHNLIYENQSSWSNSTNVSSIFEAFATQMGLNMDTYKADVGSSAVNDVINADIADGGKRNVTGTPTFFLDGKELDTRDIDTYEKFAKVIEDAYNAKQNQ